MVSEKLANERVKNDILTDIWCILSENGEDTLRVGSNEIAIPKVNENGTEIFITIKVSVPTGSRDGDAYDGYALAEEYVRKVAEKEQKAKQKAEEKAKKIERDKKNREKLAKSKAEHKA